jgi:hypothetical protein
MAVTNLLLQQEIQPVKLAQNFPKDALHLVDYVGRF